MKTLVFIIGLMSSSLCCAETIIKVNSNPAHPAAPYAIKMLELAFSHIDKDYKLQVTQERYTKSKTDEEVKSNGLINVIWEASDKTMEENFRPVRICLYKGLLGYRVFIINKKNQHKFDDIQTLDQLKKLTFGQGRFWADTRVLEANQFSVVKATKYPNLFFMVDGERFDAFPRGLLEPFNELASRPQLTDLTVEKNLMLVYRMPYYFFVEKNNKALADDIELGLNRAIADGSFDDTFYNDPNVKNALEKANIKNRKVFYIDNPLLTKETPLDRAELWLDPNSLP